MATKAELEAEVEQLKAQLASNTPPDVAALTAELDILKTDLQATADERDQKAQLVTEAVGDAKAWKKKHDELAAQSDSLKSDLQVAQDAANKPAAAGCDGNHVFLDGEKYDILWRSTVKDMVYEGYHKRNLDDVHTALVISKIGG